MQFDKRGLPIFKNLQFLTLKMFATLQFFVRITTIRYNVSEMVLHEEMTVILMTGNDAGGEREVT